VFVAAAEAAIFEALRAGLTRLLDELEGTDGITAFSCGDVANDGAATAAGPSTDILVQDVPVLWFRSRREGEV